MAQKPEATEWSALLEATRLALSTLRLEDLEQLAVRAEEMLEATSARNSPQPVRLQAGPAERRKLLGEQRLLRSVLIATEGNLNVLRRLRGGPEWHAARGLDARWVR